MNCFPTGKRIVHSANESSRSANNSSSISSLAPQFFSFTRTPFISLILLQEYFCVIQAGAEKACRYGKEMRRQRYRLQQRLLQRNQYRCPWKTGSPALHGDSPIFCNVCIGQEMVLHAT